ncbi:hypothetical protein SprV_0301312400 [Sparganum proliferum]
MVRQFSDGMMGRVANNSTISETLTMTNGVKQGCVFSPTLFSLIFTAVLMDAYRDERPEKRRAYRTDSHLNSRCMQAKTRLLTNTVHDLPLADDFELNTTTEVDMQWSTDLLDAGCANFGRTITKDKPVIMRQSSPNTQDCTSARITVDDHKPKTVDSFAYLESAPSNSTKIDDEVSIWIS